MGTTIRHNTAGKSDVYGIRHFLNVVIGDVAGMPVVGLRLFEAARSLLVRLAWGTGAGHLEGNKHCLRPAASSAPWTPGLSRSGAARLRVDTRMGRPRSAIGGCRF